MTVKDFLFETSHLPNDAEIYVGWADKDTIQSFQFGAKQGRSAVKIYDFDDLKKAYISSGYNVDKEQIVLGDIRDKWSNIGLGYPLSLYLSGGYAYVSRLLSEVLINENNHILLLCER